MNTPAPPPPAINLRAVPPHRLAGHLQANRGRLAGVDLAGRDLSGIDLSQADLRGADLRDANLVGADLTEADLRGATLDRAALERAILKGARIDRATFARADLHAAWLDGVEGKDASFRDATLTNTTWTDARLVNPDLTGATLSDPLSTRVHRPRPPDPTSRARIEGGNYHRAQGVDTVPAMKLDQTAISSIDTLAAKAIVAGAGDLLPALPIGDMMLGAAKDTLGADRVGDLGRAAQWLDGTPAKPLKDMAVEKASDTIKEEATEKPIAKLLERARALTIRLYRATHATTIAHWIESRVDDAKTHLSDALVSGAALRRRAAVATLTSVEGRNAAEIAYDYGMMPLGQRINAVGWEGKGMAAKALADDQSGASPATPVTITGFADLLRNPKETPVAVHFNNGRRHAAFLDDDGNHLRTVSYDEIGRPVAITGQAGFRTSHPKDLARERHFDEVREDLRRQVVTDYSLGINLDDASRPVRHAVAAHPEPTRSVGGLLDLFGELRETVGMRNRMSGGSPELAAQLAQIDRLEGTLRTRQHHTMTPEQTAAFFKEAGACIGRTGADITQFSGPIGRHLAGGRPDAASAAEAIAGSYHLRGRELQAIGAKVAERADDPAFVGRFAALRAAARAPAAPPAPRSPSRKADDQR